MMLKRLSILVLFTLLALQFAQGQDVTHAPVCAEVCDAQSGTLFFDGAISTDFDNAEYEGDDVGYSRTIFAVRLTPTLGYRWGKGGRHAVVAGAELLKDFGSVHVIDDTKLVAYYRYKDQNWGAYAGIFGRDELVGRYSRAFYSDSTRIYNALVQGVAGHYRSEKMFAELAVDWTGLYSPKVREKFRILASVGGKFAKWFDAGATLSLTHYANKSTFQGNVVDNALCNAWIGAQFKAFFDFDVRLGYLQALQRDRKVSDSWLAPKGGELYVKLSKWGAFVDNNIYVGENLMPLYKVSGSDGLMYGNDLYACDITYSPPRNFCNRTGFGYERKFCNESISVKAEVALICMGRKVSNQQLVSISARFAPTIYDKSKHKK